MPPVAGNCPAAARGTPSPSPSSSPPASYRLTSLDGKTAMDSLSMHPNPKTFSAYEPCKPRPSGAANLVPFAARESLPSFRPRYVPPGKVSLPSRDGATPMPLAPLHQADPLSPGRSPLLSSKIFSLFPAVGNRSKPYAKDLHRRSRGFLPPYSDRQFPQARPGSAMASSPKFRTDVEYSLIGPGTGPNTSCHSDGWTINNLN